MEFKKEKNALAVSAIQFLDNECSHNRPMPRRAPPLPKTPPLRIDAALRHAPADLRLAVLRALAESGSIADTARSLGLSYRAAWQALDTLTQLAGVSLVDRATGGNGGGGASVTAAGYRLLEAARRMDVARDNVLSTLPATTETGAHGAAPSAAVGTATALASLGLRTSLRNVCHAVVESVHWARPATRIVVRIAAPAQPHAQVERSAAGGPCVAVEITRESAELLGLKAGVPVLLMCKAMAVRVELAAAPLALHPIRAADEGSQYLAGTVRRVGRATGGADSREVTVELRDAPGVCFVGLSPVAASARRGQLVMLRMEASALILALSG